MSIITQVSEVATHEPEVATPTRHAAVPILVLAFADDAVVRWFWPDAGAYLDAFAEAATIFGAAAFAAGTADRSPGDTGAALWVPPNGPIDDDAIADLIVRSVESDRQEAVFSFLGRMEEFHPDEPHWYLPVIGVDPRHRGKGIGSALLRSALARVDADGLGAYLEATSPRNRALYERHGFVVQGEIRSADSPPLWPMWRAPSGEGRRGPA